MTKEQIQVREFMLAIRQEQYERPTIPDIETSHLRKKLIQEELDELEDAMLHTFTYQSLYGVVQVADALGDLLYVVLGTAVAYGIDLEPVFQEIHRSNMTKFIDGSGRKDGKWMKGPSYSPAQLEDIIKAQQKL